MTPFPTWISASLLVGMAMASEEPSSGLRNKPRQSVIRRLYGPDNASVRKHVRLLEEKSQRSQTGFLGDPSHKVPYENHPYDKSSQRNLQANEPSNYQPMRIRFETDSLEERRTADNTAKIDFILNEILPKAGEFWSQSLAVVPVSGNLKVSAAELDNREFCGENY